MLYSMIALYLKPFQLFPQILVSNGISLSLACVLQGSEMGVKLLLLPDNAGLLCFSPVSVCLSVCVIVCLHDNEKATKHINGNISATNQDIDF